MEKAHFLTTEQKTALYYMRRRRRELKRRIENSVGSESSIVFDKNEHKSLCVIMNLVESLENVENSIV